MNELTTLAKNVERGRELEGEAGQSRAISVLTHGGLAPPTNRQLLNKGKPTYLIETFETSRADQSQVNDKNINMPMSVKGNCVGIDAEFRGSVFLDIRVDYSDPSQS
jgi:hypothetical protein